MVWTGFDYRGEPQPLVWPATGSSFGCMDLCGFPKAAYYLHQAQWIQNRPILHLIPHWNWAGSEGKPIKVMALSNAEKVTLNLNGKLLEEKSVDKYQMVTFEVPYEAGKLEAVATTGGKEVARFAVETTGAPAGLQLIPDRTSLAGNGCDAQPVTVQVVDAQGRVVPTAKLPVKFELSGPGAIIGLNNGDPTCHEPEKGDQHSVFNGLAQVIVQTTPDSSGPLTLRASAEGLKTAETTIAVTAVPPIPSVPLAAPVFTVQRWRMSPVTATAPDLNQVIPDNDQNSWVNVRAGQVQKFADGTWAIFRAQFTPVAGARKSGGRIRFAGVTGRAEVWLDGQPCGRKESFAAGPLEVPLPPGEGERTLSLRIETRAGESAGLNGPVTVEAAPIP